MSGVPTMVRVCTVAVLACAAAGCSPSLRTSPLAYGDVVGVYTNGNLRLVTERSRFQPASGRILPTVCSEPTPDHAIAFDQSGALAATLAKLGSGAFTFDSTEAATELPGRTPGVLALRDGLYAACQSYANGVIGHDAYALILSQYSDVLIQLIRAQENALVDKPPVTPTGDRANATPLATGSGRIESPVRPAVFDETDLARATGGAMLTVGTATAAPKPPPAVGAARIEALKAKEALHAAILVACVSEHDPTRIGGANWQPKNPMLSEGYCRAFLRRTVAAKLERPPS